MPEARLYQFAKRAFDLACSSLACAVLAPVFMGIAMIIKATSRGPVLYRAHRIGLRGTPFVMYKFRTMVPDADRLGATSTKADDPRLTRIGRWLRRYKLDELPQLLNVMLGDMSIVGPRPQVEWAVLRYTRDERRVLSVPPGITDYASLSFPDEEEILRGSSDPDLTYMEIIHPKKMALSLQYVDTRSFGVDLKIITLTAFTLLGITSRRKP